MKRLLTIAVAACIMMCSGYQKESDIPRLIEQFNSCYENNDVLGCQSNFVEYVTIPYKNGTFVIDYNTFNYNSDANSDAMAMKLLDVWERNGGQIKYQVVNWMHISMINQDHDLPPKLFFCAYTNDNKLTSTQKEFLLYASQDGCSEEMQAMQLTNLFKMTPLETNDIVSVRLLQQKINFANRYRTDQVKDVLFDKTLLTYDNDIMTYFFTFQMWVSLYDQQKCLRDMAEEYIRNCRQPSTILKMTRKMDLVTQDFSYTTNNFERIKQDVNSHLDMLMYMNDEDGAMGVLLNLYKPLDYVHLKNAIYFVNGLRPGNMRIILLNLKHVHEKCFTIDDDWKKLKQKINILLRIR